VNIARISVYSHLNDLAGKVWNPAIRWTFKYAVFVVVEDDTGLSGLGECWCFDSAPDSLVAYLRTEVVPHFVGQPTSHGDEIARKLLQKATLTARHGILCSALSGMDIALNDLRARQTSVPLCQSLSPSSRASVPVYASAGLYSEQKDLNSLASEMHHMTQLGFKQVKMKTGALTVEADSERINAVIEKLPADCSLIIDGVYSYTVKSALDLFSCIPGERIAAFQSPLPAKDIAGMSELNASGIAVMATEAEYRDELQEQLIDKNAVTFLQTAAIVNGGYRRLKELDQLLSNSSVKLSLEVSSTAVAFLAASHFAAAFSSVAHVEYHFVHQVFFEQLNSITSFNASAELNLPDSFGLGLTLNPNAVTHHFSI